MRLKWLGTALFVIGAAACGSAQGEEPALALHTFERRQLTDVYYSEGISAGDINNDGHVDVVCGPYWFEGPSFEKKHEIYPPKAQPREAYADNFFSWVYDFNGDGWGDVLTVGFPGTPAYVYENPGKAGFDRHWTKRQVFDWVSNESPHFVDLVADERPELVCTRDGFFGYATIDWERPFEAWTFHAISDRTAPTRFGHGLGVGDVNGDGRSDLLTKDGWFEQPASLDESPRWRFHPVPFAGPGGAEMHVYDVDGDGDNDVITSLAAHEFGLAWFEHLRNGDAITFRRHLIMGDRPEQSRYGLVFSELHSVALADIDGDGLKDIVTGKTYWSHHTKSPMWDAGAVVYWFRLVRGEDGVDWVPYQADDTSGIGRQVVVHDLNGDSLPDLLAGGMKGAHVLLHRVEKVDEPRWRAAQPKRTAAFSAPALRGRPSPIDAATGRVAGALEGESLAVVKATSGQARTQKMSGFTSDRWSGDEQLFWSGGKPGERLDLEITAAKSGKHEIAAALTMARDYAIVQLRLDDEPLGEPLDLYHYPDVVSSGLVVLGSRELTAGKHRLTIEITGANPSAVKAHMVGLDYLLLTPK